MNSNKCKIFSFPLFLENIRRFWLVSFVAFAFYFLSGPFGLLIKDGYVDINRFESTVGYQNIGIGLLGCVVGVCSAITVFSYLNKTGSVSVMHSMPFSRKKLYVTNYLSGLVLAVLPLLLNYVIFALMKQPVIDYHFIESSDMLNYDIYSITYVLRTFANYLVSIFFIYNLSVMACVVCGNGIIATLTACGLNLLPLAFYLARMAYSETFLFGYVSDFTLEDKIVTMHPSLQSFCGFIGSPGYPVYACLIFVGISLLVGIAAYALYSVRKLETAGDSYSFKWMEQFIVLCLTFFGSTVIGLVCLTAFDFKAGVLAFIIASVVAFIASQMIARKSFKIFDIDSAKMYAICLIVIVAVLCAFKFDIFGYEKKVPKAENIESVEVGGYLLFDSYDYNIDFKDPQAIELVRELQQFVIDNKDAIENYDYSKDYYTQNISLKYSLKNGAVQNRMYDVPSDILEGTDVIDKISSCDEVTAGLYGLRDLDLSKASLTIYSFDGIHPVYGPEGDETEPITDAAQIRELIEALIADEATINYSDRRNNTAYRGEMRLYIEYPLPEDASYELLRGLYGFCWTEEINSNTSQAFFSFEIREGMDNLIEAAGLK